MNNPPNSSAPTQNSGSCTGPLVVGLLWLWIGFVLAVRFGIEILGSGLNPDDASSGLIFLPVVSGLAILLPCYLLGLAWKTPPYRNLFQTWAWAAVFVLISLPAHFGGLTSLQTTSALQLLTWSAFLGLMILVRRRKAAGSLFRKPLIDWRSGAALLITGLIALPWLAWGALGSLLDSLLGLLCGLVFGAAAAYLIEGFFIQALLETKPGKLATFLGGGFVIAACLGIMSSAPGYGFGVMQVLILIILAPLGWVWMGLRIHRSVNLAFPTLLIGLAASLPLLFFDANELALIISDRMGEVLGWAFQASLAAFAIGLLAAITSLILLLIKKDQSNPVENPRRAMKLAWGLSLAAGVIWMAGAVLYWQTGQPGLFGDRMLVVLSSQADLAGAADIQDYAQRREFVYQRLVDNADESQQSLRQAFDGWNVKYQPYYLVNAIEVPGNPLLRLWLELQPGVDRVIPSPRLRPLTEPVSVATGDAYAPTEPAWNLTMIGADRVWKEFGVTGSGVVVGQSDSGVQWDHPELSQAYRGNNSEVLVRGEHNYNWYDPWNHSPAPTDHGGHGTHTLGSVLGQHTGVAPGAAWIACANLDRNLGNPALYLDCLQFMLAPFPLDGDPFRDGRPELGAMVLNDSWGCPKMEGCDFESLRPAVQALRQAGVFTVASAGNDGPKCDSLNDPLAVYSEVFSVGSIDMSGNLSNFSSIGSIDSGEAVSTKPDLIAPGEAVLSAFPGNSYAILSGTSMAGPHVAGVVALMWSANPKLIGDIDRTEAILRQSTRPYTGGLPDCPGAQTKPSTAVGAGVLDAYRAVQLAVQN